MKEKLTLETILIAAMKVPMVKVRRDPFLRAQLEPYFPQEQVEQAIQYNPATAKITLKMIDGIARSVIKNETLFVTINSSLTMISDFTLPGSSIPEDLVVYFVCVFRIIQKLAYLYGFPEFDFDTESNADILNTAIIFIGVMTGDTAAVKGLNELSKAVAKQIATKLPRLHLAKTLLYQIIKKYATKVGIKINKVIFAKVCSSFVPVVGVALSGGLTWLMFKPMCTRLQKTLRKLPLCDPNSEKYKEPFDENDDDMANCSDLP